jgi:hypothetical protein
MTRRRVWLFSLFGLALIPMIFITGSPSNDIGSEIKKVCAGKILPISAV